MDGRAGAKWGVSERGAMLRDVASAYYLDHETMESIARRLGLSRSSVSRALKEARSSGLVRIEVADSDSRGEIAAQLEEVAGVHAHVVPVHEPIEDAARLDRVARAAAQLLPTWVDDGMVLGLAWGTTIGAIISHAPRIERPRTQVVQLNGSVSPRSGSPGFGAEQVLDLARAMGAQPVPFPVPALFDYAKTKEMMWQERSVRHVLDLQERADVALFGIGAVTASLPSRVYAAGYFDEADRRALAVADVVGDVCTVFLRADGSWQDVPVNARATGPTPWALARIPRRIGVVASADKVPATLAALRAGTMTDLVIDSSTALAVVAAARRGSGAAR